MAAKGRPWIIDDRNKYQQYTGQNMEVELIKFDVRAPPKN